MALLFGILGAVIGSFVGVVAERIYTGHSFLTGRSTCNSCARVLGPRDLIPVISWLISRGVCRSCGSRVPVRYLILELILGFLFAVSYITFGLTPSLLTFLAALTVLTFIVLYDLRHTVVPFATSTALVVFSLLHALLDAPDARALGIALITAGAIGIGFVLLHVLSAGRAMGLGDAPVAFALSLLVAPYALAGLFFSFWIGALYGVGVLVSRPRGPRMGIEVPFVPFLALGFILAYFVQWNPLAPFFF